MIVVEEPAGTVGVPVGVVQAIVVVAAVSVVNFPDFPSVSPLAVASTAAVLPTVVVAVAVL